MFGYLEHVELHLLYFVPPVAKKKKHKASLVSLGFRDYR